MPQTRSQTKLQSTLVQQAAISRVRAEKQQEQYWLHRPKAFKLESFNQLDAEAVNENLMRRWSDNFVVENPKVKKDGAYDFWKNKRDTLILRYVETLPGALPEMFVQLTHEFGASYEADEVDTAYINGKWYLRIWWD